jgi:hypothetical protein
MLRRRHNNMETNLNQTTLKKWNQALSNTETGLAPTCLVSGIILLSVAKWALILSRRRRSASLWIFRAFASVALLPDPDPDDDDISGGPTGTAGGAVQLACRDNRTGPLYTEESQPSHGCTSLRVSFPSCRARHGAILQPGMLLALPLPPAGSCHCTKKAECAELLIEIEPAG